MCVNANMEQTYFIYIGMFNISRFTKTLLSNETTAHDIIAITTMLIIP